MKLYSGMFFIFLFLSVELFGQTGDLYVKAKNENLRAQPNGDKMGELVGGTKVTVLERQPNWVKVQITGWIWEKSLTADFTAVDGYKVRASHILVKTEAEAVVLLTQLKGGAKFEELARQHSIDRVSGEKGGDLGKFGRGDLRPEIDQVLFQLKIGEVSGVVKTDLGHHIIKRVE
ncbi:MAG: peptidylprolyl isomerase [bacterium]